MYLKNNKYVIITPTYNESQFITYTLKSVINQTILPREWIIVDDGSTDDTWEIIKNYITDYPWIKYFRKEKSVAPFGANIVEVFYYGFRFLKTKDYHFLVKLDADIDLIRQDYFEYQIIKFNEIHNLGISSGITYYMDNGKKILVDHPNWRTTGALKMYRKECFNDIGGIAPIFGWDGLDEYKAMARGWKTLTFRELEVLHLKKHVSLQRESKPEYYFYKGQSFYQRGYPIEFILLKFIYFIFKFQINYGINFIKGYFFSKKKGIKQYVNKYEKRFIRKFQYKRAFCLNKF